MRTTPISMAGCALWWALLIASDAYADDQPPPAEAPKEAPADAPADESVDKARAIFLQGADHARQTRWGDALGRFEASARLHPHAGTTYNIGICLRALGRYTRAQRAFRQALAGNNAADGSELAASTVATIESYLVEIERVLASLVVTLAPANAAITVDGSPLERLATGPKATPKLVAGTLRSGPGVAPPAARFEVVLDPGTHLFVLSRSGHEDVLVRKTVRSGSRGKLSLELKKLPATLRIEASESKATVLVDGVDVGLAPVSLQRPAGDYHIAVRKQGYEGYEHDLRLVPAREFDVMARLQKEEFGLHERWWFWTAIGAAVAGAVVITYVATRPEPERPPLDGGGLGWTIRVP